MYACVPDGLREGDGGESTPTPTQLRRVGVTLSSFSTSTSHILISNRFGDGCISEFRIFQILKRCIMYACIKCYTSKPHNQIY